MSEFQREERYFVFKKKDIDRCTLPENVYDLIEKIGVHLSSMRLRLGIPDRNYVVVEDDWPEYEKVWEMIEARVTGDDGWLPDGAVPNEGGDWWYWNGEDVPYIVTVVFNHRLGVWVAVPNQYGWNRDVPLTELGGRWKPVEYPELPSED